MTAIPGEDRQPETIRPRNWCALAVILLAWNGLAAWYANPLTLLQKYDGPQYQLLARNRLNGHMETGDAGLTVRREGSHPMWRPGLVLLIQGLATLVGSVGLAAGLASALGTSLMELALLWLAWRLFGRAAFFVAFLCIVAPLTVSTLMLRLAIGQGPEPWAAAAVLAGLAALVEALRRRSWKWAVVAGLAAGLADAFRTGNFVLFAVPCALYGLAALRQRERLGWALPAVALAAFLTTTAVDGWLVFSKVDKTAANLLGNLAETEGPQLPEEVPSRGRISYHMGGLTIVPGTTETSYDNIVRRSRDFTTRDFLAERLGDLAPLYFSRLGDVAANGANGLRLLAGDWLVVCFLARLAIGLMRRGREDVHVLALSGGVLAFYFGPVVLLCGDEPTHYLVVMVPFLIPVAAGGAVALGQFLLAEMKCRLPTLTERIGQSRKRLMALAAAPVVCLCLSFYQGGITAIRGFHDDARTEQASLDALHLDGKTVACRNMGWFADRDIQTLTFPYARVPELEGYVRANGVDGILIWENEPSLFLVGTPYGSLAKFDRAIRNSPVFYPPEASGGWRWYPVRPARSLGGKP